MASYTKSEIIQEFNEKASDIHEIYKENCCNRTGKTKDSKEYFTEIISQQLIDNISLLDEIDKKMISRKKPYYVGHFEEKTDATNRVEEYIAKNLLREKKSWPGIGTVVDIQVPLKNNRNDENKGLGKIDLISVLSDGNLMIIELKQKFCSDTLLRCALEIETYYRRVDKSKLIQDFRIHNSNICNSAQIVKAVMIAKDSIPYFEFLEAHPITVALLKKLDIKVVVYEEEHSVKVSSVNIR